MSSCAGSLSYCISPSALKYQLRTSSPGTHLLRNFDDLVGPFPADQGRVSLDDDAVLGAVFHDLLLLAERMQLNATHLVKSPSQVDSRL